MQLLCNQLTYCDAGQASNTVEPHTSADTKAMESPKTPVFGFNPAVFRTLTLVHIKRVWGVPLENEINKVVAQSQRINNRDVGTYVGACRCRLRRGT
jgi:hypothetical protein